MTDTRQNRGILSNSMTAFGSIPQARLVAVDGSMNADRKGEFLATDSADFADLRIGFVL